MAQLSSLNHKIGQRIRYLRLLRKMTQEELANKIGLSTKQLSRIERGESSPRISSLEKMCLALETTPFNIFLYSAGKYKDFFDDPENCHSGELCVPSERSLGPRTRMAAWIFDGPVGRSVWSESLYTILGYPPFQVRPTIKRFLSCVLPQMRDRVEKFISSAENDGPVDGIKVPVITRDGRKRILLVTKDKVWPEFEAPPMIHLLINDVTECLVINQTMKDNYDDLRKYIAEKAIKQALKIIQSQEDLNVGLEHKLCRSAIESSPAPVIIADTDARLVKVNPAFLDKWGYETSSQVHGLHLSQVFCSSVSFWEVIEDLRSLGYWSGLVMCAARDGDTFQAHKLTYVMQDNSENLIGYASLILPEQ
ncbi:MAG: helix-turn-helix domain-containing protein [Desulfonatronovibrio sp.]